jgi:hypothetical protein
MVLLALFTGRVRLVLWGRRLLSYARKPTANAGTWQGSGDAALEDLEIVRRVSNLCARRRRGELDTAAFNAETFPLILALRDDYMRQQCLQHCDAAESLARTTELPSIADGIVQPAPMSTFGSSYVTYHTTTSGNWSDQVYGSNFTRRSPFLDLPDTLAGDTPQPASTEQPNEADVPTGKRKRKLEW